MGPQTIVIVRIGEGVMALRPETPVAVAAGETPTEASALICCDACDARQFAAAPVAYSFHDDDHFGRLEVWYESRHACACAGCGSMIDIGLSYTLTHYPLSGRHELVLDALVHPTRPWIGGRPVPIDDAAARSIEERHAASIPDGDRPEPSGDVSNLASISGSGGRA
jgi:hypothetical protein